MSDSETVPTPPGGPQRQDAPEGGIPGGHDDDASAHEGEHGSTIPIEEEQSHPEPEDEETPAQQENAETSLDQPSDG
jgi:hypothetical protein